MKSNLSVHRLASLLLGSAAALGALSATGGARPTAAEPVLRTSIGDCRPISREFAGINAKMLINDPWKTDWVDALALTQVGNIRYPGGTAGNDWDWRANPQSFWADDASSFSSNSKTRFASLAASSLVFE